MLPEKAPAWRERKRKARIAGAAISPLKIPQVPFWRIIQGDEPCQYIPWNRLHLLGDSQGLKVDGKTEKAKIKLPEKNWERQESVKARSRGVFWQREGKKERAARLSYSPPIPLFALLLKVYNGFMNIKTPSRPRNEPGCLRLASLKCTLRPSLPRQERALLQFARVNLGFYATAARTVREPGLGRKV